MGCPRAVGFLLPEGRKARSLGPEVSRSRADLAPEPSPGHCRMRGSLVRVGAGHGFEGAPAGCLSENTRSLRPTLPRRDQDRRSGRTEGRARELGRRASAYRGRSREVEALGKARGPKGPPPRLKREGTGPSCLGPHGQKDRRASSTRTRYFGSPEEEASVAVTFSACLSFLWATKWAVRTRR